MNHSENALKLEPNNLSLQAAARFAREQEQGLEKFGQARQKATVSYLTARRRELAQSGNTPLVRVYAPLTQATPSQAATTTAPSFVYPQYQPYIGNGGEPYTYQQHYDSFFGPVYPRSSDHEITMPEQGAFVKPAARAAPP